MSLTKISLMTCTALVSISLAGCGDVSDAERNADLSVNAIDGTGLNDVMLNLADPGEAVKYFKEALAKEPERVDLKRSYAQVLAKDKQYASAALVYEELIANGQANSDDRLNYAEALVRSGAWEEARIQLNAIPPSVESFDRYFLEALVADRNKEWEKADNFYDVARGLTTRPAQVLNNWGMSKMSRGKFSDAEKLFKQAIAADPEMSVAKTNMAMARGRQGIYQLPVIPMNDRERAEVLYTIALEAIRNGDKDIAMGLLGAAIDSHPQHFEAAVALLGTL